MTTRFSAGPDDVTADDAAAADVAEAGDAAADGPPDAATDTGAGEEAEAVDPVARCVGEVQPAARLAVRRRVAVAAMMRLCASVLIDTKRSVGDDDCRAAQQQMADIIEPNTQPAARNVDDVFAVAITVERGHRGHDRTRAAAT